MYIHTPVAQLISWLTNQYHNYYVTYAGHRCMEYRVMHVSYLGGHAQGFISNHRAYLVGNAWIGGQNVGP